MLAKWFNTIALIPYGRSVHCSQVINWLSVAVTFRVKAQNVQEHSQNAVGGLLFAEASPFTFFLQA